MTGKTFSLHDGEMGYAIDHIGDMLQHEARDVGVPARVRGINTITGTRAELEGEIVSVIKMQNRGKFLNAFVLETPQGLFTVGGQKAIKEDIAGETVTLLR